MTSEKTVGCNVETLLQTFGRSGAAGDEAGTFVDALVDVVTHSLLLDRADEGTEQTRAGDGVGRA